MVTNTVNMMFIGGLHPGVIYNFTIVAFNEIGSSGLSEVASIATLDEGVSILTP